MLKAIFTAVLIESPFSATRISFSGHEDGKSLSIEPTGRVELLNVSNIVQSSNVTHATQLNDDRSQLVKPEAVEEEIEENDPFPWNGEKDSRPDSANKDLFIVSNTSKMIKGTRGRSYTYIEQLGSDLYTVAWSAEDMTSHKRVAIKYSQRRRAELESTDKNHFYHGVEYMKKLVGCDNVVHILDYFQDEAGFYYIVMELFVGEELLEKLLADPSYLPEAQAHKIFVDLLKGLECMHESQVVHLDIKLDNVLLNGDEAKLWCDFDMLSTTTSTELISEGTPGLLAPEILEGNARDGIKVDIFALGVTLFSMVVGTPPFDDEPMGPRSSRHGYQDHVGRDLSKKGVSQDFIDLISCMLSQDPDTRCSIAQIKEMSWFIKKF